MYGWRYTTDTIRMALYGWRYTADTIRLAPRMTICGWRMLLTLHDWGHRYLRLAPRRGWRYTTGDAAGATRLASRLALPPFRGSDGGRRRRLRRRLPAVGTANANRRLNSAADSKGPPIDFISDCSPFSGGARGRGAGRDAGTGDRSTPNWINLQRPVTETIQGPLRCFGRLAWLYCHYKLCNFYFHIVLNWSCWLGDTGVQFVPLRQNFMRIPVMSLPWTSYSK